MDAVHEYSAYAARLRARSLSSASELTLPLLLLAESLRERESELEESELQESEVRESRRVESERENLPDEIGQLPQQTLDDEEELALFEALWSAAEQLAAPPGERSRWLGLPDAHAGEPLPYRKLSKLLARASGPAKPFGIAQRTSARPHHDHEMLIIQYTVMTHIHIRALL